MDKDKKKSKSSIIVWLFIIGIIFIIACGSRDNNESYNVKTSKRANSDKTFYILASQENKPFEDVLRQYAKTIGKELNANFK